MQVTTIGLDIAKNVFQVHAIDTAVAPSHRPSSAQSIAGGQRNTLQSFRRGAGGWMADVA
jgi:hypothetical protein